MLMLHSGAEPIHFNGLPAFLGEAPGDIARDDQMVEYLDVHQIERGLECLGKQLVGPTRFRKW